MDILPDELDSVGKGRTVVASVAVLSDRVMAIVDDKPSMRSVRSSTMTKIVNVIVSSECILPGGGESVGEGVSLVASSPEEDIMVVTLAVEPSMSRRT